MNVLHYINGGKERLGKAHLPKMKLSKEKPNKTKELSLDVSVQFYCYLSINNIALKK